MIDGAENRFTFSRMLDRLGVDHPEWKELASIGDAKAFCCSVGYPMLVRPSYFTLWSGYECGSQGGRP